MAVRHYRLVLTTVGPVHIGNGSKYSGKDYFKIDDKNVAVLDAGEFVSRLSSNEVDEYCRFLDTDSRSSLAVFLARHPPLMAAARESIAYRIEMRLAKARRGTDQYFDVAQFVKDGDGNPYVPGSSVKGMLRTAILSHLVQADRETYLALYDSRVAQGASRGKACRDIERRAFWRERPASGDDELANDVMRYVSVSDSVPLSTDDLVFAKKYDKFSRADSGRHKLGMGKISKDPSYYEGNALNIYRECLRPGTRIELALDVDERIDAYLGGLVLDGEGISSVLQGSFELYKHCFLDFFDLGPSESDGGGAGAADGRCAYVYQGGPLAGMRCRNAAVSGTGFCNIHKDKAASAPQQVTCYLGGGVDFDSKTVVNALLEGDRDRAFEISRILFAQFPTKLDPSLHHDLQSEIREEGFDPIYMPAKYDRGRLAKGKDDHRHWRDAEFGVSPHTVKLGIIGSQKYPMGKCTCAIEERQ